MTSAGFFRWHSLFILILSAFIFPQFSRAQTSSSTPVTGPEEWIRFASENSETFQAVETSIRSLEAEIKARDLELSAFLAADLSDRRDHRATLSNRSVGDTQILETRLEKPFATGTTASLLLSHELVSPTNLPGQRDIANWEISLSQDLWQNAFGRSTRLRRQRDAAELQSRRFEIFNQRQQLVITLERLYWDLSVALKEEEIRLSNIEKSENLEKWIRNRVARFAAESTDLLQVQALVSQRKLELLETRNRISNLRNEIRQTVPRPEMSSFQPDLKALEIPRSPSNLWSPASTAKESAKPWSLSSLSSYFRSQQARAEALQREDSLRPSLQAYLSYGRNGIEDSVSPAWETATGEDFTQTIYGLRFSMDLDLDLKSQSGEAARLAAESRSLLAQADKRESELQWSELERQIENLKNQSEEARRLSAFQTRKSAEERRRYTQGRSTAFQAILFEVDAAASELRYYQILGNLRKTESLARAYTLADEVNL